MLDCQGGFLAGVSIGGLQLDGTDGIFLGVDEEFLHPDYDEPTRFNDIMLVKLSETTDVAPIALNFNANVPRVDDPVTVVRFFCWSWSGPHLSRGRFVLPCLKNTRANNVRLTPISSGWVWRYFR